MITFVFRSNKDITATKLTDIMDSTATNAATTSSDVGMMPATKSILREASLLNRSLSQDSNESAKSNESYAGECGYLILYIMTMTYDYNMIILIFFNVFSL